MTVVIATYNPNPYTLSWALDSLERQTLARDRFETVIVDNGSRVPVADLHVVQNRPFPIRVVVEPENGTTPARCRGIRECHSEWIVFLDDDNYIDPDYLENALRIATEQPEVGAFGGISRFLSDAVDAGWTTPLLPYLGVRDYGPERIASRENKWGKWEPIGAGMVFRKEVGDAYLQMIAANPLARQLGRTRYSYICGEDSLLARCAYGLGYACSYEPDLKLTHFIRCTRLDRKTLARTIEGIARAWVICETVLGTSDFHRPGLTQTVRELIARGRNRVRERGWKAGTVEWYWDLGYFREVRRIGKGSSR